MEIIKFDIKRQSITCDRKSVVSDTENVYQAQYSFDEEWNGYTKFAVFKQNNVVKQVLLNNDSCLIPNEVLEERGYVEAGVYGVSGNKRYPTIWTAPIVVQLGVYEGVEPVPPTPSEWQQIISELSNLEERADNLELSVQSLNQDIDDLDENKVSKVEGYGLSQNDFTDTLKNKLDNLENYDDSQIRQLINQKQNTLIAGQNITIVDDVISASSEISLDYNESINKPQVNGNVLVGNKTTQQLGISFNDILNKPTIPSKTSDLENDSKFVTADSLPTISNSRIDSLF